MYIADQSNNRIRKVTVSTEIITTFAGNGGTGSFSGDNGPATSAGLYSPYGIALDISGKSFFFIYIPFFLLIFPSYLGNVYIADRDNNRIRKVTVSTGVITTIAGSSTSGSYSGDNGAATSAGLNYPAGVALDPVGTHLLLKSKYLFTHLLISSDNVYIADTYNNRVRKVMMSAATFSPRYQCSISISPSSFIFSINLLYTSLLIIFLLLQLLARVLLWYHQHPFQPRPHLVVTTQV